MAREGRNYDVSDTKLHHSTSEPICFSLQYLEEITCNFSSKQELSRSSYGVVYKGGLANRDFIAVKKLSDMHRVDDKQFKMEVICLTKIKHQNVVQLKGYCAESRWEMIKLKTGLHTMAQLPSRMICFEYLDNKTLRDHISDASSGLEWYKRFEIIKGICSGLHFIHAKHIVHLDLKPETILLDDTMKPKISDFGLSKLMDAQKSQTMADGNLAGSLGYIPAEYYGEGIITSKADIFSFGVIIIEIITGSKNYSLLFKLAQCQDYHSRPDFQENIQKFIKKVVGGWRKRYERDQYASQEVYTQQVKECMDIALQCLDHDPKRRPNASGIFQKLCAVKTLNWHEVEGEGKVQTKNDRWELNTKGGLLTEPQSQSCTEKENDQNSADASSQAQSETANKGPKDTTSVARSSQKQSVITNMELGDDTTEFKQRQMVRTDTHYDEFEKKLCDPTAVPICLALQFLKTITWNFAVEQELGWGRYGVVYKGVLRNGLVIAVKRLVQRHLVDDDNFRKEVCFLMEMKHQHIVQLKGYCAESSWEMAIFRGKHVMAHVPKRMICLEYLCNKSLRHHISDESSGLDWYKRFEIIKGISSGLHFLHERSIVHLDLKPENILMDIAMKPKIADFGLSQLLGAQKSQTLDQENVNGTLGYMAPEYINEGEVSSAADIFSFGVVIIEIITGSRNSYPWLYPEFQNIQKDIQMFIEEVIGRWRKIFEPKYASPEIYTQQVKECVGIALKCLDNDSKRRPNAAEILQRLCAVVESTDWYDKDIKDRRASQEAGEFLSAQPLGIKFPLVAETSRSSCSLHLTNNTNHRVAFTIQKKSKKVNFVRPPLCGFVDPGATKTLNVEVTVCKPLCNEFFILESTIDGNQDLPSINASDYAYCYSRFFKQAKEKGRKVQQVTLSAVFVPQPQSVTTNDEQKTTGPIVSPSQQQSLTANNELADTATEIIQPKYCSGCNGIHRSPHPMETWREEAQQEGCIGWICTVLEWMCRTRVRWIRRVHNNGGYGEQLQYTGWPSLKQCSCLCAHAET